jgi:hypothetical protein
MFISPLYMFRATMFPSSGEITVSISSPVTDLEWPRGFQEVKVPSFLDNGTEWW